MSLHRLAKSLLYKLEPEAAHDATIGLLKRNLVPAPRGAKKTYASLACSFFDGKLNFTNPIGLAAGFDKNAKCMANLSRMGFGFVEAGTVTPLPQPGNPKPRLFRLAEDEAIINRFGFNSLGAQNFGPIPLSRRVPIGINIGANKDSPNRIEDYTFLLARFAAIADYITVNISSPNTPGLRDLQQSDELKNLLAALSKEKQSQEQHLGRKTILLLKIAPDMEPQQACYIADQCTTHHFDGLIISNTTIQRMPNMKSTASQEAGGLSGKPLFHVATELLRSVYKHSGKSLLLVGVGGIGSAEDAYAKIRAGASLVQLYTALIYQGFELVPQLAEGLDKLLGKDGYTNISQAVGKDS